MGLVALLSDGVHPVHRAWIAACKDDASYQRRSLDRDGSGRITVSELQVALAGLGVPVNAAVAGRMVDLIDVDGSSDISFQEFRRFAVLLPQSQVLLMPSQLLLQGSRCAMPGAARKQLHLQYCLALPTGFQETLFHVMVLVVNFPMLVGRGASRNHRYWYCGRPNTGLCVGWAL